MKLKEKPLSFTIPTATLVSDEFYRRHCEMVLEGNEVKHRYNLAVIREGCIYAERQWKKEVDKDREEDRKRQKKREKEAKADTKKLEKMRKKMDKENNKMAKQMHNVMGLKDDYKPRPRFFWAS
ncbi:hypothetical protein V494_02157 [Pseudogymnoascus sp. VKM F-4513 (FW-928)]|nr:hypothetical protein V494_02157 [Pseudogymnoascus sp. VKM F-4513 (FW-928)]